ncbi:hypothetical protein ACFYW9_37450 [Streptomyces sp. NPDC002698]|uniref:hypothetical protein n=1 Tax=Streptomyces sp. NPDC002698 TaxID=3364660 RepID=UPI0036A5E9FD
MHTRTTTALTAVLLLTATATACSSSSTDNKPRTASAKTTSGATASTAAKTSPLKIGTGHHWSDTDTDGSHISGTTTVKGYTQPIKMDGSLSHGLSDFEHPVWATLDVKLCADSSSTTVMSSQKPWTLGFPDDTRIQAPLVSGAGVPKPEYPVDSAAVTPGSCLRGKITFSMERGTRPDRIIYGPEGRDPVEWSVPKA